MKVQSIITKEEYNELMEKGILYTDTEKIFSNNNSIISDKYYKIMSAYHWMSAKLAEKTCCYEYIYPRWVWRKYDGIKGWRTLKQVKESIEVAGEYVVLNLNIPEDRLLLSQFDEWHYVLNGWYLAVDDDDYEKHEEWKEKNNLPWDVFSVPKNLEKKQCTKTARKKIIKSWERIFKFSLDEEDYIQGVCWFLKKEDVKSVYSFVKTQSEIDKEKEEENK